jgi:hypothetical protein
VFTDASDVIEQFDRRYRAIPTGDGRQYIVELRAWLEWLRGDSRLEFARSALRAELEGFVTAYKRLAGETADRLAPIRNQIPEVFPDAKDTEADRLDMAYTDKTFARFDERLAKVRTGEVSVPDDWREDPTLGSALVETLESKLTNATRCVRNPAQRHAWVRSDEDRSAESQKAEPILEALNAAKKTHIYELRELSLRLAASGSYALAQLEEALGHGLNPAPGSSIPSQILKLPKGQTVGPLLSAQAVFATKPTAQDDTSIAKMVQALRPLADRVVVAVRQQLSARAGLISLAHRFKIRCQHYDLEELRDLVKASPSKAELLLTARFARYLYDAGHAPLFRELTLGNSRADLVSLGNVFVEAKQLPDEDKQYVLRGYWQLRDGLHQLPPEHGIRAALLVVFVLGGPLYEIDDEIHSTGLVTMPLVIDLREASQKGSKAAKPAVRITSAEFRPELTEAPAELKTPAVAEAPPEQKKVDAQPMAKKPVKAAAPK